MMEGDLLQLPLSLTLCTAITSLALILPLSCHAKYTSSGGPQFDLLLSSRASFSKAGTLELDAHESSSDAYALLALSILMPTTLAKSGASFAGTTFDFSIDADFEYGALSFIISPDSNISANYPHVFPYLAEVSPQPKPGRFTYVVNVTHIRDGAVQDGGSYLFRYAINNSLVFSGIGTKSPHMTALLQYDAAEKKCRAAMGAGTELSPLTNEYVATMDLGSVLNKSVYVGLFASAGGVFHVSRWSLLLTGPVSSSIQSFTLIASCSPSTAVSLILLLFQLLAVVLASSPTNS